MRLREQMPELDGADMWLNSDPIGKRDLLYKPTLIHFWSVSCTLCKSAMQHVNALRDAYKDRIHVIAVHMPRSETDLNPDEVKKAALQYDITQPIFVDNKHILTDAFGNQYVPSYYIFDKTGKLRHFQAGGGGMKTLQRRVNRVLDL